MFYRAPGGPTRKIKRVALSGSRKNVFCHTTCGFLSLSKSPNGPLCTLPNKNTTDKIIIFIFPVRLEFLLGSLTQCAKLLNVQKDIKHLAHPYYRSWGGSHPGKRQQNIAYLLKKLLQTVSVDVKLKFTNGIRHQRQNYSTPSVVNMSIFELSRT